jgi:hypothetical protein
MAAAGTRRRLLYRNTICFGGKRAAPAHTPREASPGGISFRDGSKSSPLRAFGRNPLGPPAERDHRSHRAARRFSANDVMAPLYAPALRRYVWRTRMIYNFHYNNFATQE